MAGRLNPAKITNGKIDKAQGRGFEIEAYKIGYSYDTSSYPLPVSSLNDINDKSLMEIKTKDGEVMYEKLDSK